LLQVPPGVDFEQFNKTWRGDEMQKLQKFLYYGHVRDDLDLGLINDIANHHNCDVTIVGKIADNLTQTIDSNIKIISQQPYGSLPNFIKSADVLLLPYKVNQFTSAIIPAKFYECLATGKPILSTRLPSLEKYSKHITLVTDVKDNFQCKIKTLRNNHDRLANIELAKKASWDYRFSSFYERLISD
jgi:glycosyltransferase involved in cell wall biosynthesis